MLLVSDGVDSFRKLSESTPLHSWSVRRINRNVAYGFARDLFADFHHIAIPLNHLIKNVSVPLPSIRAVILAEANELRNGEMIFFAICKMPRNCNFASDLRAAFQHTRGQREATKNTAIHQRTQVAFILMTFLCGDVSSKT
jgi:hypothetical protein